MRIVLVEPQIPPNTGNIARLCAATRVPLHLVGPLGFELSDRYLKRAGLDYWKFVDFAHFQGADEYFEGLDPAKTHFFSKKAERLYTDVDYAIGDCLVFGSETQGLPSWIQRRFEERLLRIPMFQECVRSLNLASAVSIVLYEVIRQTGWDGRA